MWYYIMHHTLYYIQSTGQMSEKEKREENSRSGSVRAHLSPQPSALTSSMSPLYIQNIEILINFNVEDQLKAWRLICQVLPQNFY